MEHDYADESLNLKIKKLNNVVLQEAFLRVEKHSFPLETPAEFDSLFVGSGICSKDALSYDIPFDVLGLILTAEKVRCELGLRRVYHLVADNHALVNKFALSRIEKVAEHNVGVLKKVTARLGFRDYEIVKASDIVGTKDYADILNNLPNTGGNCYYERFEVADIEYFRQYYGAGIKLGWFMSSSAKFDETHFDLFYLNLVSSPMVFLYCPAGKRLSDRAPNAVPYTLLENDLSSRFVLNLKEDAARKLTQAECSPLTKRMIVNHYKSLLRLYRNFGEIPKSLGGTAEQINFVINKLLECKEKENE